MALNTLLTVVPIIIPAVNEAVVPRLCGEGPAFDTDELKKLLEARGAHRVPVQSGRDVSLLKHL